MTKYLHEWTSLSITRMVGSHIHLQLTQWSYGVKVTIWQMATSTQRTIVSNASVWLYPQTLEVYKPFPNTPMKMVCSMDMNAQ